MMTKTNKREYYRKEYKLWSDISGWTGAALCVVATILNLKVGIAEAAIVGCLAFLCLGISLGIDVIDRHEHKLLGKARE